MRIIPLITAATVTVGTYMFVIERDRVMSFARGDGPLFASAQAETVSTDTEISPTDTFAAAETVPVKTPTVLSEETGRVKVVALRSVARTIDSAVVLRGQTQALRQVEVRSETSATVLSEPLRKGAHVAKGDLLCELASGTRPSVLAEAKARLIEAEARVPEARARLDEAHARLREAEINLNAAKRLSEDGYASDTRVAAAEAAERTAIAAIASAQSGLQSTQAGIQSAAAIVAAAEKEMERLTITAPFDGLLESDTAELGSLMQPGSLCGTVIQLDSVKLVGFVPEIDVNRIEIGALAGAELAAGAQVKGRVTFVSRSADPETRTFEVEIEVPNPDLQIRDGQTADIVIAADGAKAHKLPQSALTLNNEGQLGVRTVSTNQVVDFVPVKLLRDESDGVWLSGLPEKADVIVLGQDFVTQGVLVAPTYKEAL
ncbi:efflux RND transporter periplasmic adaptor subunit [Epibacterium ulvae]|uniref:efflux RND transporter periplasmic adaptor subunit n=1 Tax=Epibacterium ulvae TaxID=1156985 RepID=UPI002492C07B|nr:efflux RND transporter periplasmic adaptor subunit [Epibacterium ulvae]